MDYSAFTNESLIMMYESIRGALASDDALEGLGEEPRFRIRMTPEWKKHAGNLESEMLKRGIIVDIIDWSDGQATLPIENDAQPELAALARAIGVDRMQQENADAEANKECRHDLGHWRAPSLRIPASALLRNAR
jgi:hypothetical protein